MSVNYCQLTKQLYEALGHALDAVDCSMINPPDNEGIWLPFGDHVITVGLDVKPNDVYVSLLDDGAPVCGSEISNVGVTLLDNGFVLYVHVKSNQALVKWIVRTN